MSNRGQPSEGVIALRSSFASSDHPTTGPSGIGTATPDPGVALRRVWFNDQRPGPAGVRLGLPGLATVPEPE